MEKTETKKTETKKTETKKTETKKTETKKAIVGTKKPFWDGRSRASTPGYRENYNSIFKQRRNFRRSSKWKKHLNSINFQKLNIVYRH